MEVIGDYVKFNDNQPNKELGYSLKTFQTFISENVGTHIAMKVEKIRDTDSKEIEGQLRDMQEQLFRLRFQMTMGQTEGLKKSAHTFGQAAIAPGDSIVGDCDL